MKFTVLHCRKLARPLNKKKIKTFFKKLHLHGKTIQTLCLIYAPLGMWVYMAIYYIIETRSNSSCHLQYLGDTEQFIKSAYFH